MHGRHRWPICIVSGKARYGERKDAQQALKRAQRVRARAEAEGGRATWTVVRSYRCPVCQGWHITSRPTWTSLSSA